MNFFLLTTIISDLFFMITPFFLESTNGSHIRSHSKSSITITNADITAIFSNCFIKARNLGRSHKNASEAKMQEFLHDCGMVDTYVVQTQGEAARRGVKIRR